MMTNSEIENNTYGASWNFMGYFHIFPYNIVMGISWDMMA
jgi:hypothetical protein